MVAIKIRSSKDIIRAYLENLGFFGKELEAAQDEMLKKWEASSQKQEISVFPDGIILEKAKKVFAGSKLSDEQLIARYKYGFLLSESKNKYKNFNLGNESETFAALLKDLMFATTPDYCFAEMKPQKIETPQSFLNKIFHKCKKD